MRDTMAAATGLFTLPDIPESPSPGMAHRADADCQGWRTQCQSLNGLTTGMTGRGGQGKRAAHVDYTCMRLLFYRFVCLKNYFCTHAMMQERKTNPRTLCFFASHDQKCRGEVCLPGEDKGVRSGSWHVRPGSEGRARAVFARAQCS